LAAAYNARSISYGAKGNYDRAIADYDQVIALDPKLALAFTNRGIAYAAKGDYDRAIADHNEAIRLNPKAAKATGARGESYLRKHDYDHVSLRVDGLDVGAGQRISALIASMPLFG
jgi:tetratricopeptide (TPR) repeat protein